MFHVADCAANTRGDGSKTRRFVVTRLWLALLVLPAFTPSLHAQNPGWKAGVAKIVITPEKLMWMSGYGGRTKPAEGKLHDLWAKALVLEDAQGNKALLVTLDLVGIGRDLSVPICRALEDKYRIPREAICLAVSHTHTGPVVGHNLNAMYFLDDVQQQLVREYTDYLPKRILQVVDAAFKDLGPAELSWGIGSADFAVNRRNNKEADVPKIRAAGQLKGPVDHDVPVLSIRDQGQRVKALVVGYACHATVLSFQSWSGDYPGFTQLELEKNHPGAVALFWAGCGADQNPLPRRTVALAEEYGKRLARSVDAVLEGKALKSISGRLGRAYTEITLPFDELPSRAKLAEDALSTNKFVASRARLLLEQWTKHGTLPATYPYPIQVWQLGDDLTWVTLGGEVVVDYALRLKKELRPGQTWVMGYANDVMAYIPSLRVLKEGGYEGGGAMIYYGLPTIWGPRVEEVIVAGIHEQSMKARGK